MGYSCLGTSGYSVLENVFLLVSFQVIIVCCFILTHAFVFFRRLLKLKVGYQFGSLFICGSGGKEVLGAGNLILALFF